MVSNRRPPYTSAHLEAICQAIADTEFGLTGAEIGRLLAEQHIPDVAEGITKWKRLYSALAEFQNVNGYSNHILVFLQKAMQPSRYLKNHELFETRRFTLNKALSFVGFEMLEDGKFRSVHAASTISEAQQRADKFSFKLEQRNAHQEIFRYCKAELLVSNYFHSVFEAVKSIADRIRTKTNLNEDGQKLIDKAFSIQLPLIQINDLITETERNEHTGLAQLIKGLFSMIRNPTAHTPKIIFAIDEDEALDIMTTVSMIHKKLDKLR